MEHHHMLYGRWKKRLSALINAVSYMETFHSQADSWDDLWAWMGKTKNLVNYLRHLRVICEPWTMQWILQLFQYPPGNDHASVQHGQREYIQPKIRKHLLQKLLKYVFNNNLRLSQNKFGILLSWKQKYVILLIYWKRKYQSSVGFFGFTQLFIVNISSLQF